MTNYEYRAADDATLPNPTTAEAMNAAFDALAARGSHAIVRREIGTQEWRAADNCRIADSEAVTRRRAVTLTEPQPRPFQVGDRVTIAPSLPSASQYNETHGIPSGTPVPATVTVVTEGVNYVTVEYPDGTPGNPDHEDVTHATGENTPQEATDAPQTPADPLEAWEAGLLEPDYVRARIWEAADAAADAANACGEYERTVAWPNGHTGRDGVTTNADYDEPMGPGTVTFRRTVIRREYVLQELTVDVEAGDDAWEAMRDSYDWNNVDVTDSDEEEDDYGPEEYDNSRESLPGTPAEPRPLAALLREAIESNTPYRGIRDAILQTARDHGAPLTVTHAASITAQVSRPDSDTGQWSAPTGERIDNAPVSRATFDVMQDRSDSRAYNAAQSILERDGRAARIAWGTLAIVTTSAWEVPA